ncbi:hypothetical protein E4634_19205 [Mangrovimicrobium sediminis]|uniref:FimV N-terminal domain-containing protein n=1 Tax=Mangrovimicrobium sediminis TaxID=2562682 RepID=A0A4Z0LVU5_9GAMM|nr:FimV/HubP family polar landmark protein [Haliea sp. SAOS-164]TGD71399.1 hypothetical protein E4634_19205 [Haliea sp. SAOS-164]
MAMARKFSAVVFSLGCLHASSTYALGLGDLQLESFLNEPLQAKVDLLNVGSLHEDEIIVRLATRADFDRMGVERAYFLTSIKFEVNLDASGRGSITMTSEDPVLEPYLDFIVEARWPDGRLLREYTVLVDPPLFETGTPVVSASQRVEEVEGIPAPDSAGKKPEGAAATSGTRVDVRKSNLGPGEMPQRDFNAQAGDAPQSGGRYMIHRDDTLWQIAESSRPEGASVHQTMLDIQRLNPDAFINGNINQIKAGFIIYLPSAEDISSQDLEAALAEVREQNEAWQASRGQEPAPSRPSLRISADPAEEAAALTGGATSSRGGAGDSAALGQARSQIAEMENQVDSLERLVSLKDAQIAELQAALAEAGVEADALPVEEDLGEEPAPYDDYDSGLDSYDEDVDSAVEEEISPAEEPAAAAPAEEKPAAAKPEAKPESKPKKLPPAKVPPPKESGWMSYALYGLGALVLAILGLLFVRWRRSGDDEVDEPVRDAFADVKLKTPPPAPAPQAPDQEPLDELLDDDLLDDPFTDELDTGPADSFLDQSLEPAAPALADEAPLADSEGGEYASDMDSGDALAEADIYIAYGRYPQARELLKSALASEPENTAYRLKLLEAELQLGNRPAAREQLYELEARGDAAATARARELLGETDNQSEPPAGLAEEIGGGLESDFVGLEIEGTGGDDTIEDDLDLSADFLDSPLGDDDDEDDEDLVIAADANGMSTKLDLARAYIDMGDEDGARQILEEVVAEGSEENRSEAQALLDRID